MEDGQTLMEVFAAAGLLGPAIEPPGQHVLRACVACPYVYTGPLACPMCGEPGEPLEVGPRD